MASVRQPAVAGAFYPGRARDLEDTVRAYLSKVDPADGPVPKAIIAPHAGYVYSGQVAATAYARIEPAAGRLKKVVLLGPCHRVPVRGLALSGDDAFATPLGEVPVDKELTARALELPQVQVLDASHHQEHSLEVHLPFLQAILDDFAIVPLVVGEASAEEVAEVIERLWGGPETLVVVSTDLSHYQDYETARRIDGTTSKAIENLDPEGIGRDQACGRIPVGGLLALAKRRGLRVETLELCNSGDTAGDRDRVVGYGSWVFFEDGKGGGSDFAAHTRSLLGRFGARLLFLAAASIEHGLKHGRALAVTPADHPDELRRDGACFVTLRREGRLRGCIGSSEVKRPLVVDVADNAFASAFRDRRFKKLGKDEVEGLKLSISVLSPSMPIVFTSESDLLAGLRPGIDGLIIEDAGNRALFLPSVWRELARPSDFLQHLKVKAGLQADHWSDAFKAWRFIAEEIADDDLDDPAAIWKA